MGEPSTSAAAAVSPGTRFTLLSTHHLNDAPETETTLSHLLERSEQLAEEAREALPYSFDECTFNKGYLRQSVWSCIDCGEKGVCYGCSISCHAEHKLVELWTRRHFRCDCPTTSMPAHPTTGRRTKCTLNPPDKQPQPANEENRYGINFTGKFCRCDREYDPETEVEAMLNCIGCEDWFHESCLNLGARPASKEEINDEDEEDQVLIRSESYDGLVCAACVQSHPVLREKAGEEGWMIIEPADGGFKVVGRPGEAKTESADLTVNGKRPAEDEGDNETKRARVEEPSGETASKLKGKGDVFLAHGEREKLKTVLTPEDIATLPFPLHDEEIYEPPQDDDQEETLEQVTDRVVGALPRAQALEALYGYQSMKENLSTMLAAHAQEGRAVSKEDIESFFEQLRSKKKI